MPSPVASSPSEAPALRTGVVTAVTASVLGVVLTCVAALVASSGGASTAAVLRSGVRLWVVSLGSGIVADDIAVDVVPIGGTLLAGLLLAAVATRVQRGAPVDDVAQFAATVAGTTGLLAALFSQVSGTQATQTSEVRAAIGGFVVGGLAAAWSAARCRREPLLGPGRDEATAVLRAAGTALGLLLGTCAVVVAVLLVGSLGQAADLWAALDPGAGESVALGLACVLAVPTLVVWVAAVTLGPGVSVGTGTSLDLNGAYVGDVPGLPVLAVLPEPGAFGGAVVLLGLVPVVSGLVAGWRLEVPAELGPGRRAVLGAAAGGVAGVVLGALLLVSGGAVGPGRMSEVGPLGSAPPLVALAVLGAAGAVGAVLAHYREARAR